MNNTTIDAILEKYPSEPSSLIQVLIEIQNELRWLPKAALKRVKEINTEFEILNTDELKAKINQGDM